MLEQSTQWNQSASTDEAPSYHETLEVEIPGKLFTFTVISIIQMH
jgi:hypothetical protein